MASPVAIAIACDDACKKIEDQVQALGGGELALPRLHKDRELLRRNQLQLIADALETIDISSFHAARDLVASGEWTKAQLEEILLGESE